MEDRCQEIAGKYDLVIYNTYRTRGAQLLETNQGLKLLCGYDGSECRLDFEDEIKSHLQRHGYPYVDLVVHNLEGKQITTSASGDQYIMKDWFDGDECSLKREDKILLAVANLAKLHCSMVGFHRVKEDEKSYIQGSLPELFSRRARELKRVKSYIRDRKQKNSFETAYLSVCEGFCQDAAAAIAKLTELPMLTMLDDCVKQGILCHGNYTYHNIIILRLNMASNIKASSQEEVHESWMLATTNFEKACLGFQVVDLYQFMRKVMEKNDWNISLGEKVLREYQRYHPLDMNEQKLLYILLLFPEKFWKITNCYYNNKKSWIPQKNVQKLLSLSEQIHPKKEFLLRMQQILNMIDEVN